MKKTGLNTALNHCPSQSKGVGQIDMLIDWVQVTFKDIKLSELLGIFGINLDDTYYTSKGLHGYQATYTYKEKIKFMISNQEIMGIHLILSGKACREWEEYIQGGWDTLFQVIWSTNSKVTRIDIAFDSFTKKYFTTSKILNAIRNGTVSTRSTYVINTEKINIKSKEIKGHSIRFGNGSSEVSLIFYDKLEERKQASYEVDPSIKVWERMELRLRGYTANNLVQEWFNNDMSMSMEYAKGILTNYVNFKQYEGSNTVRNRGNIKWWSDFLDSAKPLQLSEKAKQSTIQRKKEWFEYSVSKTLSMIYLSNIEDFTQRELVIWITQGLQKFNNSDIDIINQYRIEKGGSIITQQDFNIIKQKLSKSY